MKRRIKPKKTRQRRCAKSSKRKRVMGEGWEGGQRSKLNVPQGSVWGRGEVTVLLFCQRVKGHLKRGIINKLGIDRKKVHRHIHTGQRFTHINAHRPLD